MQQAHRTVVLSLKTTYQADPAPGVPLGVVTQFRTPYLNLLTLRGVKRAPNITRPSELMVFPDGGPLRLEPTPSWVVAVGDAPDYGWAATAAGAPTEESPFGCVPRERVGGMTILTRARVAPPETVRQAKAAMALLVRAHLSSLRAPHQSLRAPLPSPVQSVSQ
jgi:hypothetical protein